MLENGTGGMEIIENLATRENYRNAEGDSKTIIYKSDSIEVEYDVIINNKIVTKTHKVPKL